MQKVNVQDKTSSVELERGQDIIFHFTERKRGDNTWVVAGPITLNGEEISLETAKALIRNARDKTKFEESHE